MLILRFIAVLFLLVQTQGQNTGNLPQIWNTISHEVAVGSFSSGFNAADGVIYIYPETGAFYAYSTVFQSWALLNPISGMIPSQVNFQGAYIESSKIEYLYFYGAEQYRSTALYRLSIGNGAWNQIEETGDFTLEPLGGAGCIGINFWNGTQQDQASLLVFPEFLVFNTETNQWDQLQSLKNAVPDCGSDSLEVIWVSAVDEFQGENVTWIFALSACPNNDNIEFFFQQFDLELGTVKNISLPELYATISWVSLVRPINTETTSFTMLTNGFYDNSNSHAIYTYDYANDTWTDQKVFYPSGMTISTVDQIDSSIAAFDSTGAIIWLFHASKYLNDTVATYQLAPNSSQWESPTEREIPSARLMAASCLYNGEIYYSGGMVPGSGAFNGTVDLWKYNTDFGVWTELTSDMSGDIPSARYRSGFTLSGNYFFIWGGYDGEGMDDGCLNDMYRLNMNTLEWTLLEPQGEDPALLGDVCTPILTNHLGTLLLAGGCVSCNVTDVFSLFGYNILSNTWTNYGCSTCSGWNDAPPPSLRFFSGDVAGYGPSTSVYIYGGTNTETGQLQRIMYKYHLASNVWQVVQPSSNALIGPPSLWGATLVSSGVFLILYGGIISSTVTSLGTTNMFLFNIQTGTWSAVISDKAPMKTGYASVVALPQYSGVAIFGGMNSSDVMIPIEVFYWTRCPDGTSVSEESSTCTSCSPGEYNSHLQNGCQICPSGLYEPYYGSWSCSGICSAGFYGAFSGATNASVCVPCPRGSAMNPLYDAENTIAACLLCPNGTYNNASGSTSCLPCPININATCPVGSILPSSFHTITPTSFHLEFPPVGPKYLLLSLFGASAFIFVVLAIITYVPFSRIESKRTALKSFFRKIDRYPQLLAKLSPKYPTRIKVFTPLGGILGVGVNLFVAGWIGLTLANYFMYNIEVQNVLLPQIPNNIMNKTATLSVFGVGLSGQCVLNNTNTCHPNMQVSVVIPYQSLTCSVMDGTSCNVTAVFVLADIVNSLFSLTYSDATTGFGYSQGWTWKLTIEGNNDTTERKFISTTNGRSIHSPSEASVFSGKLTSYDSVYLTPFQFQSEVSDNEDFLAVMLNTSSFPQRGSLQSADTLYETNSNKAKFALRITLNGYTQFVSETNISSLYELFVGIFSVFGSVGIVAAFKDYFNNGYSLVKRRRKKRKANKNNSSMRPLLAPSGEEEAPSNYM
eukprot:TRINITY_DN6902_c0_g1_i1.p1 TRINITY_DN6902_c0_g1~~TRINITY_DN6902_c0_g1_i1.p1  ORF type:complete len:1197 (-),score=137.49 TRINITY_DN6902_c0_g1_i1:48-3638(-)